MTERSSYARDQEKGPQTSNSDPGGDVSEHARLAQEVQRLRQETEQRNAELAVINSVQQGLSSKLDMQAIYELVGDKIRELFHNTDTEIRIYEPKTNLFHVPYSIENGQRVAVDPIAASDARMSAHVIRTGQTLVINENFVQELKKYGAKMVRGRLYHPRSGIFVPLMVSDQARGLIILSNVEREQAFDSSDVRLLQTLANSMSTALQNARLFDETQRLLQDTEQQAAELAIINSVQEGLASQLDVQAIYDLVGNKIREVFKAESTLIALYDRKKNEIQFPYVIDETGKRFDQGPKPLSTGFSAHIIKTKVPLVINRDYEKLQAEFGSRPFDPAHPPKAYLGVPMLVGQDVVGVVALSNPEENTFNDSDVRLLTTIANSMSVALENARLFDETQRLLKETEQRNAELAIINSVQEGLASKLDMQAIYELVGDKIREIFHDSDAEIRIYDSQTNLVHIPYITDAGERITVEPMPLTNRGISSHVLRTGQTLVFHENMAQAVEKYGSRFVFGEHPAKSAVFVPLMAGDQARGLIVLGNVEREHAFSPSDVRLFQTLANSMSTALENARLFDETQRLLKETEQRNAELAIINSIQQGLAAELDFQAIVNLVGNKLCEVLNTGDLCIRWYDEKTKLMHFLYEYEHGERLTFEPMPPPAGSTFETILKTRQPILWNTPADYSGVTLPGTDQSKSLAGIPIISSDRVLGAINIENYEREYAFGESELRLLTTIAASLGTALENAQLFDEVQKKNAEITEALERETASNDILRVIAESPTDIQPVLEVIARNAAQLSGLGDAIITLREGDFLRVDSHYGDIPTFPPGQGLPLNRDSVAGRAILEGRPLQAIHNRPGVQSEYPEGDKAARRFGYRMSCAVPLLSEGKAIGAISIRRLQPELLTEKQIALVQSFANQATIAMENVRLFNETTRLLKETEQRNDELAIINSVQEGLASRLDMQAIYDLVGDKIRDLLNTQSVWIIMFDPATRTRRVRYSFERGQRYYMSELFPYNKLTEYLITTKKPLVINQNFTEAIARFEMVNMAGTQEQIKSIAYIPIITGEDVKGFISLPNIERENAFSESDINLLSTFASSMSIALENIRLFDETRRLLKETEQADQAKSAFLSSMSHELRTPLNAIINFVEMVARGMIGPVNQEQVEILDQALHSSKHLLNLINDVLDISKIQAGQLTLFIEDQVSVQVEVEAALSIVGGLLQEKGLQLIRDIDPHLPLVPCDRRRLRQVLLNLISNAIKFTSQGTVTVSVKHQGSEVLFAVIDTGPGIPPEEQALIFEPFLQAENGERQVQGTGLGLPISRSLVRAHGGELWVDSQRGEGSAFFFTLPVTPHRERTP
ncbi:MAG TPA: GAF domain-containing protein [Anaerolineales bacterium]|nr:GAF domain-containing protein [Anaerolineales bacterium]